MADFSKLSLIKRQLEKLRKHSSQLTSDFTSHLLAKYELEDLNILKDKDNTEALEKLMKANGARG